MTHPYLGSHSRPLGKNNQHLGNNMANDTICSVDQGIPQLCNYELSTERAKSSFGGALSALKPLFMAYISVRRW